MSEGRWLCTVNVKHEGATLAGMARVCAECYCPVEWVTFANYPEAMHRAV